MIDPNESWGEFFKSVILLEEAKVIPIRSLSVTDLKKLKNQSKMKKVFNWRNSNYIECAPIEEE